MKKLFGALSLSLLLLPAAGCKGKHPVVKHMEESANKVCACKDMECVQKLGEESDKKEEDMEKKYKDWKPNEAQAKQMAAAEEKMEKCLEEMMKK